MSHEAASMHASPAAAAAACATTAWRCTDARINKPL
jgi:hypothetical protein